MFSKKSVQFVLLIFLSASIIFTSVFYALYVAADSYQYVDVVRDTVNKKITVIIDAGHGGEDAGAVSDSGILEKEINFQISEKIRDVLILLGINVKMTRTEDKLLYKPEENIKGQRKACDLKNRYLITKEYENAVFVSIHTNKFPNKKYGGFQVYYSKNNPKSKNIAFMVQSLIHEKLQNDNNRKIKEAGSSIYLLDRIECPAILVECGFLSNDRDCKDLTDSKYTKKMAFLVANAILETI